MLELGVIELSQSEWRSNPVMIPKPDRSIMVCLDFRRVNEVYKFDAYPKPRIQELLERLGRARFLSTLNMTKGYWQILLEEKSKAFTAFAMPRGLFQFTSLPFGLHRAAASFQHLADRILAPLSEYTAVYIDDVIIFCDSWEDHLKQVGRVLASIQKAGLTVNPEKCRIGDRQVQYLGFIVGGGESGRLDLVKSY